MLRYLFWFFLNGELAFLVGLGFRSREYSSFVEWWWEEGAMIWLITVGVLSILLLALQ
jgi:hypothetical protein